MENEEIILNEDIEPTPEPFVIPLVYNYKADTKEFTGIVEQADKDNAKSAQVGHFVPMVHANATLLEPPEVEENQIQVYSKEVIEHKETDPETGEEIITYEVIENWDIEADYRKNFLKVDNDLNVTDITTIGEQIGYIVVDKATGEDIKANQDWYKIVDNKVVKKSDEEYEQEQAEKEAVRIANLHMTRGDIFRGLLLAKGVARADVRSLIEAMPEETPEQRVKKELALIDFDEALEYYRGVPLIDTVGKQLGITPEQMSNFFDTKDWHELINEEE